MYPFASLNGCFLGIRSNAIGGTRSSTLYSFDCYGSLTLSKNLNCNSIQTTSTISSINADPSQTTISVGYYGQNKLISSLPAYDTHRLTFNMRGFDTMYTQAVYNGVITNVLYGSTTINTLGMTGTISFPNNGAGIAWSTNSQIYDDSNLHISSNTNLLLYILLQHVL